MRSHDNLMDFDFLYPGSETYLAVLHINDRIVQFSYLIISLIKTEWEILTLTIISNYTQSVGTAARRKLCTRVYKNFNQNTKKESSTPAFVAASTPLARFVAAGCSFRINVLLYIMRLIKFSTCVEISPKPHISALFV